ncbi:MAG: glycoside hydrolase family 88 protein [Rugosibacter sp.]|jgi:unsaturated rhamnogalacturonyl hydrolase|nr:glycoside hydrolase family 88 protein [Rugosibacter sp.]
MAPKTTSSIDRHARLVSAAQSYAWWLGTRSLWVRSLIKFSGWRLSRLGYRFLGRPSGALTWPLGLAFLCLNAARDQAKKECAWIEKCFQGLIDSQGQSTLAGVAIDRGGLGYAALRLFELTQNPRYLTYAKAQGEAFACLPGAQNGRIPYTVGKQWVLVDTVAFICPFLARLSRLTAVPGYAHIALRQLEALWQHGRADDTWVFHAFDATTLKTSGISGWGRGIGWLLIGMVDTVCELPEGEDKILWLARSQHLLEKLALCQREDGHWPWRLDLPAAPPDSSVTALIAYALARWQQANFAQAACQPQMLARARSAIDSVTDDKGLVGQCSGEAMGIGDYSTAFGSFMWAQAPAVAVDLIAGEGSSPV